MQVAWLKKAAANATNRSAVPSKPITGHITGQGAQRTRWPDRPARIGSRCLAPQDIAAAQTRARMPAALPPVIVSRLLAAT